MAAIDTKKPQLIRFIMESNRIEGINGTTAEEVEAYEHFLTTPRMSVSKLEEFVSIIQPGAELRDRPGMNCYIGSGPIHPIYKPLDGGIWIKTKLEEHLCRIHNMLVGNIGVIEHNRYKKLVALAHIEYETLHPFTDGNGRSGRMLWLRAMGFITDRLFLHEWYYQSLALSRDSDIQSFYQSYYE